jgi:hypothetical protein
MGLGPWPEARAYGAQCTPDFFGFNGQVELQYRGRLDASRMTLVPDARRDLFEAMKQVAVTGHGPADQTPSMGRSIKWKDWGRSLPRFDVEIFAASSSVLSFPRSANQCERSRHLSLISLRQWARAMSERQMALYSRHESWIKGVMAVAGQNYESLKIFHAVVQEI